MESAFDCTLIKMLRRKFSNTFQTQRVKKEKTKVFLANITCQEKPGHREAALQWVVAAVRTSAARVDRDNNNKAPLAVTRAVSSCL